MILLHPAVYLTLLSQFPSNFFIEAIVAQGHKHVTINGCGFNSFPTRGNELLFINIFYFIIY